MGNFFKSIRDFLGAGKTAPPQAKPTDHAERRVVVTWTTAAIEHVRQATPANPNSFLRVGVIPRHDGSFSYTLEFDDKIDDLDDYVDETHGIKAVVAKLWAKYLVETKIDWTSAADGREGFTFDNPNATKTRPW